MKIEACGDSKSGSYFLSTWHSQLLYVMKYHLFIITTHLKIADSIVSILQVKSSEGFCITSVTQLIKWWNWHSALNPESSCQVFPRHCTLLINAHTHQMGPNLLVSNSAQLVPVCILSWLVLPLSPFSSAPTISYQRRWYSMEGARNLRYLSGSLSYFFNCHLTREVFLAVRNLTFMFSIVVLPICIFINCNYFVCCLFCSCFLHQSVSFIRKVLLTTVFSDPGILTVALRGPINICCMDE